MKLLLPGRPIPEWLPIEVIFGHEDPRHYAVIGSLSVAWRRKGSLHVRPLFGGVVILVECLTATLRLKMGNVQVYDRPLIPLWRGEALWILRGGVSAEDQGPGRPSA